MANFKVQRLNEDVKRELTDILRSVKDPRVDKLLTVVKVDLSGDYSYCKVYVSSLEGMERTRESVKGLESAAGYIRRELCLRVKMRRSPELHFVADDSIEYGAEISKKLNDLIK